jgi:hypothetical protein
MLTLQNFCRIGMFPVDSVEMFRCKFPPAIRIKAIVENVLSILAVRYDAVGKGS